MPEVVFARIISGGLMRNSSRFWLFRQANGLAPVEGHDVSLPFVPNQLFTPNLVKIVRNPPEARFAVGAGLYGRAPIDPPACGEANQDHQPQKIADCEAEHGGWYSITCL